MYIVLCDSNFVGKFDDLNSLLEYIKVLDKTSELTVYRIESSFKIETEFKLKQLK